MQKLSKAGQHAEALRYARLLCRDVCAASCEAQACVKPALMSMDCTPCSRSHADTQKVQEKLHHDEARRTVRRLLAACWLCRVMM